MRELENYTPTGDPDLDTAWRASVQTRFAANATEQRAKTRLLDERAHAEARPQRPDAGLLDALPERELDVTLLPADLQRALYDVLHLELRYQPAADELVLRVTLSADTVPALADTIDRITDGAPHADACGGLTTNEPAPGRPHHGTSVGDVLGAACGGSRASPIGVTCGNARLVITEHVGL
jgi:hypothetical protein